MDSLSRTVDVQNEKFQAIKDAGIIVFACECLASSLKNSINNGGTIENVNGMTRLVSVPLKDCLRCFLELQRRSHSRCIDAVCHCCCGKSCGESNAFPLSGVDQREHACLLFEFAAEYCAESTKKELSAVVNCIIETTLLGSSKKSARDASMTCLQAFWKNLKNVRVESRRKKYLFG